MATPTPAPLGEFKKYLQKGTAPSADDGELQRMLEAATEAVEGWQNIGPIVARSFTDRVVVEGRSVVLPRTPVVEVTSLTRVGDGLQYLTAALDLDSVSGIVTGLSSSLSPGTYVAIYEAGRDPVPVALKEATLVIGKHLWESQRGPGRRMRGEDAENRAQWTGYGYLIPNRAAHLMQPYANVLVG
jgi:hypothetical protein